MMGAVLRHCQTMALAIGFPVFLSQMTVVSLWLVIPMESMSAAVMPSFLIADLETSNVVSHISSASCSTHPGLGNIWVNSFCVTLQILPEWSKRMHLELVVPWSSAITYFMGFSPCCFIVRL